jgi:hypothetical protein
MTNSEGMTGAGCLMTGRRCSRPFEFLDPDLIRYSDFRHLRRVGGCSESVTLN